MPLPMTHQTTNPTSHNLSSSMAIQTNTASFLLDTLYCQEEQRWEEDEDEAEAEQGVAGAQPSSLLPLLFLPQDLFWEDEELLSLFSKEQSQRDPHTTRHSVSPRPLRDDAVEWMLRVAARHGFSALTAVLAVNYADRFLSRFHVTEDKPWMIQLVAVACLSLAAKVEETYLPLLLDLQIGEAKYVFEAKAIQRMELLVLSTLKWKMHPVTPLSFLDHIIRRLGLKREVHWQFLRTCESLLLSVVSDLRSLGYLPSVLATATMMHAIEAIETADPIEYKSQLLHVLRLTKEEVEDCYLLISKIPRARSLSCDTGKRKHDQMWSSPSDVTGSSLISSTVDHASSNDDHYRHLAKRSRFQIQEKATCSSCNTPSRNIPSLGRDFFNVLRSPN